MQPGVSLLRSPRWHRLRPWPPVHVKGMVSLLQKSQRQCQSHFRLPSTIQRSDRTSQPGGHPIPSLLLSTTADGVESIPDVGWVCPELSDQTRHWYDPFQVHPRISTTDVSLVRRADRVAFNYRMVTTQRGGLGPSSHPSATGIQAPGTPGQSAPTTRSQLPAGAVGLALDPGSPPSATMQETQSQVCWTLQNFPTNHPCIISTRTAF